jgi:hypothetical protein
MLAQEKAKPTSKEEIRAKIQGQIDRLAYLWGTGPVSIEYAQWVDRTLNILKSAFGEDSQAVRQFYEAVGEEGSSVAQRSPLYGPWGLWERMRAGEAVLRQLLADLK